MTTQNTVEIKEIDVTEAAAIAVQALLDEKGLSEYSLRVFISGGGCSGYQYGMALENNIRDTDFTFNQHNVSVVIDDVSINYLNGAIIDYVDDVMGSGFKIDNPNSVSSCGCGSSNKTDGDTPQSTMAGCDSC